MKQILDLFFVCIFSSLLIFSQTLKVPEQFKSIQSAIVYSSDGDTVLVADGTYYENINYLGKKIIVASHYLIDKDLAHINNTIIDGSRSPNPYQSSVVYFMTGEDTNSILCGITITGGKGTHSPPQHKYNAMAGGGIIISKSGAKIINNKIVLNKVIGPRASGGGIIIESPKSPILISNNYIENNEVLVIESHGGGAGIFCLNCDESLVIRNNIFAKNLANDTDSSKSIGGAIKLIGSNPIINNNLFKNNTASFGGSIGTSYPINQKESIIENNTFVLNKAHIMGGAIYSFSQKLIIRNCVIWGNYAPTDPQIVSDCLAEYCNIKDGYRGENIIDEEPQFADTLLYYLSPTSPCLDKGKPDSIYNDIEDSTKPDFALFPSAGNLRNDMGTYGGPKASKFWGEIDGR